MENYITLFDQLDKLSIGSTLSQDQIQSLGLKKYSESENKIIYTVQSQNETSSHIVHTDVNSKIIFIQLAVPVERESVVSSLSTQYGVPEIETGKSTSEILRGYPSKGYNFIYNSNSEKYTKIQKIAPTTTDLFMSDIGVNYVPVSSTAPQQNRDLVSTIKNQPIVAASITVIIFIVVILFIRKLIRK